MRYLHLGLALFALILVSDHAFAQAANTPAPPVPMNFPNPPAWVINQAVHAVAVTPNDSTVFAPTKGLVLGDNGSGGPCLITMVLAALGDTAIQYGPFNIGTILPAEVISVHSTGTTCTRIVAWY